MTSKCVVCVQAVQANAELGAPRLRSAHSGPLTTDKEANALVL